MNKQTDLAYFTEENSAAVVNARIDKTKAHPRMAEVIDALTRHLHAFIKEVEPTHEEWLTGIKFLTETGHMCTEWRQEFILLSDILGVSMLVDAINNRRPSGATENTILGPFYVANRPMLPNGDNICKDMKGEPCLVTGTVRDTEGRLIPGAVVDVWQTNDDGFYDVQQKGVQPEENMRGAFTTDAEGRYWFRTVKPRFYPIPDDGPVGKLLGQLGRHPFRAAHIHAIVTAEGYDTVITHIFEPNCRYLREDTVFGVKESLVGHFEKVEDTLEAAEAGFDGAPFFWKVQADWVLARSHGGKAIVHHV
ncbi:6-chlorohydroxyquinol-1,2-dioxygenase [Rhizobium chutanense]|uniref:6-chlorohydroxyquinol-1,2-dioxygenase n=1 Tax=Rhizobium chutanense TaxID=2035448 RepID=A0A2A6JBJ4_9HYPH|nr:intradiol ring-cleavage dioxygenase [Rhizobium chutanense]PDT03277.1 6-chlorohydroxyquinol-1,2-dioxygenase [Rhizobium chutanense]